MPFKKFNEFLNEQKKSKKNKKSKKAFGDVGDQTLVYKPDVNKYEKIKGEKDALGNAGDQKNVYEPKTEPLQSKSPAWNTTNVKEWLNKTKKLPLSEFAKNIYEEKNKNVEINFNIKNTEDLIEGFVKAVKNNPKLIESTARELNRSNLLESFLRELTKIENSKKISESISDPVGFESSEEGDGEVHHHHHHHHHHHDDKVGADEEMGDEDEDEEMGDEDDEDADEEGDEEDDLDSDDLGPSEDDDMEDDAPLGRRKPHSEDYFSDEPNR